MEVKQPTGISIRKPVQIETENSVGIEATNAVRVGMKKAVSGLHLVHVSRNVRRTEIREATTGRPIAIPRIMAVAAATRALISENQPVPPEAKFELAFYRKYTEALLRRYLRVSMEIGRVPSVMGRDLFRGNASHYKAEGFDDAIILCADIERCLTKLRRDDQRLIQRIAIQGYTHEEAAPMLGITFKTCVVNYSAALDRLTELFLKGRILEPQKCCQDPEMVENWLKSL
jgi:hypothetical protein